MLSPNEASSLIAHFHDDVALADAIFDHFDYVENQTQFTGVSLSNVPDQLGQHNHSVVMAIRGNVHRLLNKMSASGLIEWPQSDTNERSEYRVLSAIGRESYKDKTYRNILFGFGYTVERAIKAVWFLEATNDENGQIGQATSFHIGHGWFMTCAHCLAAPNKVQVVDIDDPRKPRFAVQDILEDASKDIAVFKSPGVPVSEALNIRQDRPSILEPVLVLHCPVVPRRLETKVATTGEVNAIVADYQTQNEYLMISARTAPGSSGGAVLDERGRVCGLAVELVFNSESTGADAQVGLNAFYHAVPSDELFAFLKAHGA